MKRPLVSEAQIRAADQYLKGYRLHSRILRLTSHERRKGGFEAPWEEAMSRTQLFRIRQFLMSLEDSDEKLFLYNHYIRGESVEECAQLLGICRSSGFRLKRRALALAACHLEKNRVESKEARQEIS